MHVRVSDTTQNDNPTISPSQPTMTVDDEENHQELGSVDNTNMTIENLQTKETCIQLLKLMWGEFVVTLCHIGRSRMRTMKGHHEY